MHIDQVRNEITFQFSSFYHHIRGPWLLLLSLENLLVFRVHLLGRLVGKEVVPHARILSLLRAEAAVVPHPTVVTNVLVREGFT